MDISREQDMRRGITSRFDNQDGIEWAYVARC